MDLSAVLKLLGSVDYNHSKQEVTLRIGPFSGNLPVERARWHMNNPHILEKIAADCIINRRIMTASMRRETIDDVEASLNDLISFLESTNEDLGEARLRDDSLLSTLLTTWRSASIAATQAIKDAKQTEANDLKAYRELLIPNDEIATAAEALPDILCSFRRMAFPYAYAIISMMPKDNPVRIAAEQAYAKGFTVGLSECGFDARSIPEPEWEVAD
jgi:hypothetical protein